MIVNVHQFGGFGLGVGICGLFKGGRPGAIFIEFTECSDLVGILGQLDGVAVAILQLVSNQMESYYL